MRIALRYVGAVLAAIIAIGVVGHADQASVPARRALILYDGTSTHRPEGVLDAAHLANLLGHFDYRPVQQPIEDYRPGGMATFDAVFVIGGAETTEWPLTVIADVRQRTGTAVWIGFGAGALLDGPDVGRRGVRVDREVDEGSPFNQVRYHGVTVGKGEPMLTELTVADPATARVHATTLAPDGRERPYVVQSGSLWIVADVPFAYVTDHDRYFVFCDLLHDMLGVAHPGSKRALIRLEDVTPQEEPEVLRRAVDVFVKEGIPFQIGVVPIFRDPSAGKEVFLSDRPDVVAVLHEAVAKGGTIVLHGSTHQYRGVTPDDFEFWDDFANAPRNDDSADLVRRKISAALDEMFRNDLFPIAWETPHYTASVQDYREFGKVFSTVYERPLIANLDGTQQIFPYPAWDTRGLLVIPEDLGYLPAANPSPAVIGENALALSVVRDGIASAYVHDFIDPALLRDTVRRIRAQGYEFVSLKAFPCRVAAGNHLIATAGVSTDLELHDEFVRDFILEPDGTRSGERWSSVRQSGVVKVERHVSSGQVLVAVGTTEPPPARPGVWSRFHDALTSIGRRIGTTSPLERQSPPSLTAAVLWREGATGEDANDQASYTSLFEAYGAPARKLSAADVTDGRVPRGDVLAVPHGSAIALPPNHVSAIADFVRQGGAIVLDGRSALAERLGVRFVGELVTALDVKDSAEPGLPLHWQPRAEFDDFRLPAGAVVLASDASTGTVTLASFRFGGGNVLYLGALLDPFTPNATSRYPFLVEHVLDTFGRALPARRATLELYFDPGLRPNVSIETLAAQWRRLGVRVIYAAAWEFRPAFTYDYERLIRVCHANGILVYAWFEFPQVTSRFWQDHPEWREVPAKGDKMPSWRLAMNLANRECRAAALQFMTDLLGRWAWDGVNLAELHFDGDADGDAPEQMVPLNADVRATVGAEHGFDPLDLFNPASPRYWKRDAGAWHAFLQHRRDLVVELNRAFLQALRPFAQSGHEIVVTALDSVGRRAVEDGSGVDTPALIRLMREVPFTLQVEDPAAAWTDPPTRYLRVGETYRKLLPPGATFMFDVNVVADRRVEGTHLPSPSAVGGELAATLLAARRAAGRVAVYGEATVRGRDLELLPYAAAAGTVVTSHGYSWAIAATESVEIPVPSDLHDFYVSGTDWPCWRPGFVLLPPGRHDVSAYRPWFRLFDMSALRPQLLQLTAPLVSASVVGGRLAFEYDDRLPVIARLGRRSVTVTVDGMPFNRIDTMADGTSVLALPAGHHEVEARDAGRSSVIVDFVSVVSSSLIVAFGTMASLLLVVLYGWIRIRRAVRAR